ncbi:MAG: 50S ribosomal protein L29 [Planctomycetes bacterium]|nr:50S ribosomal protein L29 [Planctomycetota bacterium]
MRAQAVTEKLSDTSHLAQTKREIARIFTVLTERGEKDVENQQYHLETRATHR